MPVTTGLLENGPNRAEVTLILAHGAGAPMDSPFMQFFAEQLADRGMHVVRFEFPYMQRRRTEGTRSPPNRAPILEAAWLEVIATVQRKTRLVIGGKSLGGRIASMIVDQTNAEGLICLGYPFHPVGKPDRLRTEHLERLQTRTLICQGERDVFGNLQEVPSYRVSNKIQLHWLADGDHDLKPRKKSGRTTEGNWLDAIDAIAAFLRRQPGSK